MPLHRDIYWIGRQWAVTGHGMQAVNRKLHGGFDIEISRLWDDGILDALCAQNWFNPEDFIKGLVVARERYPLPPGQAAPAPLKYVAPPKNSTAAAPPKVAPSKVALSKVAPQKAARVPEPPKPAEAPFDLRIDRAPAKFTGLWRVGVKR